MFKKIFLAAILLISMNLASEEINWLTSSEEAFTKAKKENKSVFVLITAPSWCYWCIKFENDVLEKSEVIKYLNKNYINLRLLDKVNGKDNPELINFIFEGYPTISIFDNNWGKVEQLNTFNPDEFIQIMNSNIGKEGVKEPSIPREYKIEDKILKYLGDKKYSFAGDTYNLITRDYKLFYLLNNKQNQILFIPYAGGLVLTKKIDPQKNDWGEVEKLGNGIRVGD